ncbi:MAG TPA: porin [Myxococcaceae bacterium]|nr:porin [Myxococcaceae bacterium]
MTFPLDTAASALIALALALAPTALAAPVPTSATEATPPATSAAPATPAPQGVAAPADEKKPEEKKDEWFRKLSIRGYTQFRYNRLPTFAPNDNLVNAQGDRFLGRNNGFGIRRARVILSGDITDHLTVYLQPDFASVIGDQLNVTILRDWYADIFLDPKKEFRIRAGQSKIPFGFENMQSSSNRLALDRNDPLNSAVRDERDIGLFFYWAPAHIRERFKHLVDSNLKGSGDYGVVGVGVYNGQTANNPERNDNRHVVARVAWPFLFGSQYVEANAAAYAGQYNVTLANREGVTYSLRDGQNNLLDARAQVTLVVYPQPFGFQAEYNVGVGPSLGGGDESTVVASRFLHGGYAQVMYKLDNVLGRSLIPFVRGTLYDGGKKHEANAPRYHVRDVELGVEWQFSKAVELTLLYAISNRTSSSFPYNQEQGHLGRAQLQFNY